MTMESGARFDPYDPAIESKGPLAFAELAQKSAVFHYKGRFEFYISSDPAYIRDMIFRDTSVWTSSGGVTPTEHPKGLVTRMMQDNSGHLKIRRIVQRGFSPVELKRLAANVDEILDDLIDALVANPEGKGDLFEQLAMEVKKVLERLVERLPGLRLAGEPVPCPGFNVWGKTSLPVAWR